MICDSIVCLIVKSFEPAEQQNENALTVGKHPKFMIIYLCSTTKREVGLYFGKESAINLHKQ